MKRCCPLMTIVTVVLVMAAVGVFIYMVLKRLDELGGYFSPPEPDEVIVEAEEADQESGVRYTTDQDFV